MNHAADNTSLQPSDLLTVMRDRDEKYRREIARLEAHRKIEMAYYSACFQIITAQMSAPWLLLADEIRSMK